MSDGDLKRPREAVVEPALLQERLIGKRSAATTDVGEIDAALHLGMTDDEVRECYAGPLNTKGFDLRHRGVRYEVKALRESTRNKNTLKATGKMKLDGYDVLLVIVYSETFEIRSIFLVPQDRVAAAATHSNSRIPMKGLQAYKV